MNRGHRLTRISLPLFGLLLLTVACGGAVASPSPSPAPTPSPSPSSQVTSAAQAAALVFASDRRFIGLQPLRSDMVGQSSWYEAVEDGDGYAVTITFGAGDCIAGCIERHTYAYHVDRDGTITLTADEGDVINIVPAPGRADPITVRANLLSGPTCPVVQDPPDPNCAERPLVNVQVLVFDAHGTQVADGTTAEDGSVAFTLPAGAYYVVPAPVEGLMGQAAGQAFAANGGDEVNLLFSYDTGIR